MMDKVQDLIQSIEANKLMVAVRTDTPEKAFRAAKACVDGGVRFVEITFSVPDADQVMKKLAGDSRCTVGAGTVLNTRDARKALRAGASYIVSPHCDGKVIAFAKKEGAVSIPGACTPTEIWRVHAAGGDIIKLFPFVQMGGLGFLKEIRGPFPHLRYMLSGGLTLDTISQYLDAKPSCILVGSSILRADLVKSGNWEAIEVLAREFVSAVAGYGAQEQGKKT